MQNESHTCIFAAQFFKRHMRAAPFLVLLLLAGFFAVPAAEAKTPTNVDMGFFIVSGKGAITVSPVGLNCTTASCTTTLVQGSTISVRAVPADGYAFNHWDSNFGNCSGTSSSCSIKVNAPNYQLYANFIAKDPTLRFSASPKRVAANGSTTLTWSSKNTTSCTATGDWMGTKPTSGTLTVTNLTKTSTFNLTCTGDGGTTDVATETVTMKAPVVPTVSLSLNPASVVYNGSSTLTWSSTNATSCTASGAWTGAQATSGTLALSNLKASTSYTLTCSNTGLQTATQTVQLTVAQVAAPTVTLSANPTSVAYNGNSALTWSSTNATSCTASGAWSGTQPTSGTLALSGVKTNASYTLTCTGASGTSATQTVALTVAQVAAPTVTLSANPTSVAKNGSSTLAWSSTNATSCTASGGWTGAVATSGTFALSNLTATQTYTLGCTNTAGVSATQSVTVTVTAPVNGACGTATLTYASSAPVTGLCSAGTPSTVTGNGPWTWSCAGLNNGTTATCTANVQATSGVPTVLYTDVVSGPNTGGENNKGMYLSIFGKNFGTSGLGSTTRVFIGGVEVDNYRAALNPATKKPVALGAIGSSRGRGDIQQITVQVGALPGLAVGVPYPITVYVNGVASNSDKTFTINPGNIYFVSLSGNDTTGDGSFASPYRHLQLPGSLNTGYATTAVPTGGVWGIIKAGDTVIMRGGTYNDNDNVLYSSYDKTYYNYYLWVQGKSGCAIGNNCAQGGGKSSGPITVMGYPGEEVFIDREYNSQYYGGGIRGADQAREGAGYGAWINLSNLHIESGYTEGAISVEDGIENTINGGNWRIVNNELSAASAVNNVDSTGAGLAKAGGIAGNGVGHVFDGNYIHDIWCGPVATSPLQNHGIYVDADGTYDIGYNYIARVYGGNGVQSYINGSNGSDTGGHMHIHHNLIHDVQKHGINIADGTTVDVQILNNIVYNVYGSGLRFNASTLTGAKVYNNVFYNVATNTPYAKAGYVGAVSNDWGFPNGAVDFKNNIFYPATGANYIAGSNGSALFPPYVSYSNNVWYNGQDPSSAAYDTHPLALDPKFVSIVAGNEDFHLQDTSPAINAGSSGVSSLVTNDFAANPRPVGGAYDIGAYER